MARGDGLLVLWTEDYSHEKLMKKGAVNMNYLQKAGCAFRRAVAPYPPRKPLTNPGLAYPRNARADSLRTGRRTSTSGLCPDRQESGSVMPAS